MTASYALYMQSDVVRPIPTLAAIPIIAKNSGGRKERNNFIFRVKSTAFHRESLITGRQRLTVNDPRFHFIREILVHAVRSGMVSVFYAHRVKEIDILWHALMKLKAKY